MPSYPSDRPQKRTVPGTRILALLNQDRVDGGEKEATIVAVPAVSLDCVT